jgi:nucleoside-diphosphate kinase
MSEKDLTLVLIKPDGLTHSLTGDILTQLSAPSMEIAGAKVVSVDRDLAEAHYWEHKGKPYFETTIRYLLGEYHSNHRVMALAYYGEDAIATLRKKMGPTNPLVAKHDPAALTSIRAKYGSIEPVKNDDGSDMIINGSTVFLFFNLVHGSDGPQTAEYELKLWFQPGDIAEAKRVQVAKPGSRFETVERIVREFDQAGNQLGEKTVLAWKEPAEQVREEMKNKG